MKKLIAGFTVLFHLTATAQSPGLTINVIMDSVKADGTRYKIEMKICEPKKMTERGDWFTHDTSTIDFTSLKPTDINCGEYLDKGAPTLISGKEEKTYNHFKFSNQIIAWEKILVFKISNASSRGWSPEMYIILPVKLKSFVTNIDLAGVEFVSGKIIFLADENGTYEKSSLVIRQSLKDAKTVEVKNFHLKDLLVQK